MFRVQNSDFNVFVSLLNGESARRNYGDKRVALNFKYTTSTVFMATNYFSFAYFIVIS